MLIIFNYQISFVISFNYLKWNHITEGPNLITCDFDDWHYLQIFILLINTYLHNTNNGKYNLLA